MPLSIGTNYLRGLYAGNLLWHTSAFIHFSFRQQYMMRKISKRSKSKLPSIAANAEGDEWHHDIMAYLGYINVGYAALAGFRLWGLRDSSASAPITELEVLSLTILGIANASQAWGNFMLARSSGRWIMGTGFDRITVLDALFTVLDGGIVLAHFLQ